MDLRLEHHQRGCIAQAATLLGESVEVFLVTGALQRAEFVLASRSRCVVTAADIAAITSAAAHGAGDLPALRYLLAPSSVLEHAPSRFSPVRALDASDDSSAFDCGVPRLNHWLTRSALAGPLMRQSATFVITEGARVSGYYTLTAEQVAQVHVPDDGTAPSVSQMKVMILLRLAVDRKHQRQGMARTLVKDGLRRFAESADATGVNVLLVDAQDDAAQALYRGCGFTPVPTSPYLLYVALRDIRQFAGSPAR